MKKKLFRSRKDKFIGGVAGGLAEFFDIDSSLVRILIIISVFLSGGLTILGYFIMMVVIPEEPMYVFNPETGTYEPVQNNVVTEPPSAEEYLQNINERKNKRALFFGVFLVIIGLFILLNNFLDHFPFRIYAPIIVIIIGIAILLKNSKKAEAIK